VVARYVGGEDKRNANLATPQAVILMAVSSGGLGLVGYVLAEPLMRLAGADAAVLPLAVRYVRVVFFGLIAMELVPSVGGMLNTAGAPQVRLTMTLWVMGTQVVTQPLLTRHFGIEGAAAAVVWAHAVGMVWGLGTLSHRGTGSAGHLVGPGRGMGRSGGADGQALSSGALAEGGALVGGVRRKSAFFSEAAMTNDEIEIVPLDVTDLTPRLGLCWGHLDGGST
jgi:hypothetical protein